MEFEQLRPHQQKAVQMLRDEWKDKRKHQVWMPTGAGKTAFSSYLVRSFYERNKKSLFIAPFVSLVDQTNQRFQEYGLPPAGIIWRDHPDYNPDALIQIASADTLIRRDWPNDIDLVVWDESHTRRSKLLEIMESETVPFVGLSATPYAPWMGKHYESLIKPIGIRELINQGYLADYEVYAPDRPDVSKCKVNNSSAFGMDYKEDEVAQIMQGAKIVGNIVENWLANGRDLPTILFACNVLHANEQANRFNAAGVTCEVITAHTPVEERAQILERYRTGITKILSNVGTLTTGLDEDVRCIIYARPTKSRIRWDQCIGRALRTAKGKGKAIIFDHSGTYYRLGKPGEYDMHELFGDSDGMDKQERIKKEVERLEKLPKECPKCHYPKDAGVHSCPKCGFTPRPGEDVETDETRQLVKLTGQLESMQGPTNEDKQQFYSMLMGLKRENAAKGKVYKDGFYNHKFKSKFGEWPNGLHPSPTPPSMEFKNWIKSQNIRNAKRRSKPVDKEFAKNKIKEMREVLK
jgi:DNA repair protein RadD